MHKVSPNIALNIKNASQAIAFYQDVLGMEVVHRNPEPDCVAQMKWGMLTIWLSEESAPEKQGRAVFEVISDDLEASRSVLLKNGCQALQTTSGEGFKGQFFADPYGLRFHVYQSLLKKEK